MKLSPKAEKIYTSISAKTTKLGEIRAIAKEIKKDHELAMELWSTGEYLPRQLAILVMDKKQLSALVVNQLISDIEHHGDEEQQQLVDWLMANQLMKDKSTLALIENWQNSTVVLQRRVFWYYQGRLRWMGNTPPPNTAQLLDAIEKTISKEPAGVQWAMNFTACWIGLHEQQYRQRVIALAQKTGLYKDEMVAKGCTPQYIPEFIRVMEGKRQSRIR